MTEVKQISAKLDTYPSLPPKAREGYSESRTLAQMEEEMKKEGFVFSFREHLRGVSQRFPETLPLSVFDSGCGDAVAAGQIKKLGQDIERETHVIGLTDAPRHIAGAKKAGIDELIVGKIADFDPASMAGKVHFLLDYQGPARYDNELVEGKLYGGGQTIPKYATMLVQGGSALLAIPTLLETTPKEMRDRTLQLFQENGLRVTAQKSWFALVEKTS